MAVVLMIHLDGMIAMVQSSIANGILRQITVQRMVVFTVFKEGQQIKHVALAVEVKDDIINNVLGRCINKISLCQSWVLKVIMKLDEG
mmetsp:Transcript_27052/g.33401  ORF Transcript_27052/g.33401 Transcript_27052/m.33401 type:complete len:88 (-) Transcript_27052:164-427(-)